MCVCLWFWVLWTAKTTCFHSKFKLLLELLIDFSYCWVRRKTETVGLAGNYGWFCSLGLLFISFRDIAERNIFIDVLYLLLEKYPHPLLFSIWRECFFLWEFELWMTLYWTGKFLTFKALSMKSHRLGVFVMTCNFIGLECR